MERTGTTRSIRWLMAILLVASARPVHAEDGATLSAMQIAYSMELNARARYVAFAECADDEGHAAVACLFRTVARAESVHAINHAQVIDQLHGAPAFRRSEFAVGTTRQNLETAIVGEMRERATLYPQFARYARTEHLYDALASCNYARCAEATHERVFRAALHNLEGGMPAAGGVALAAYAPRPAAAPADSAPAYYVCLGDGCVFSHAVTRCPQCGSAGSRIAGPACRP